ncbi:hypothetical protein NMY22_g10407 [Coprinellus aureogranulatus]|nr:hypothetical protein NMY22_g10407 [Coprinellus aureogranulatus]
MQHTTSPGSTGLSSVTLDNASPSNDTLFRSPFTSPLPSSASRVGVNSETPEEVPAMTTPYSQQGGSQGQRPSTEDEVVIAVMGATGSGKTTFINTVSGSDLKTSSGLFSCTNAIGVAPGFSLDGRTVILVDTPGFDDTKKSDTDILKMIAQFLTHSYEEGKKLAGVIYIHRISDFRVGGTSSRNFSMFRKLCGDSTLKNVVVMTNMWGEVSKELGEARERELASEDEFFKPVLDNDARMVRHDGTLASAQALIRHFLSNIPEALQIQREIVEEKKDILETAAGEALNKDLIEQRKRHEREMADLEQEHKDALDAKDEQTRREIEAAAADLKKKMDRVEEESRKLRSNFQEENKRFRKKMDDIKAQAKQDLEDAEGRYKTEIDDIKQQSKTDGENAAKREAELEKQIAEAKKRRGTSFWDVLGVVLVVATGGLAALAR